jgi:hypothetical protein
MRSFLIVLGIGSLAIAVQPASGQRADELQRGAKVRVTVAGGTRTLGTLDRVTRDTIALRRTDKRPSAESAHFQRDLVTSMEVSRRAPGKGVLYGGLLGLLIGGGAGFVLGAATYSEDECFIVCSAAEAGAFVGALGAMISVPIGMIVGGTTKREWRQVDITAR